MQIRWHTYAKLEGQNILSRETLPPNCRLRVSRYPKHILTRCSPLTNCPQLRSFIQNHGASSLVNSRMQAIRSSFSWAFPRYIHATRNSSSVVSEENPERYCKGGYHPISIGDRFNNKYQIISKLGFGLYSTVWLAKDLTSDLSRYVALKILTADSHGGLKSVYELEILKQISQTDPENPGYQHVVRLLDNFVHEGPNGKHLCLVLELLGQSVLDLQKNFPNQQLPSYLGRQIAKQLLHALDWLHCSCGIIHTDIKPDNILIELPDVNEAVLKYLIKSKQSDQGLSENTGPISQPLMNYPISESSKINIRLIDFGVASWKDKHLTEWIQPPSLRAPEVFLGAPWEASIDLWGLACVIYELIQGRVLFRGRPGPKDAWTAEEDQIAQMIELFGPIPASLRKRGKFANKYFDEDGNLLHIKQLYPCSLQDLLKQTPIPSMSLKDNKTFEAFLRAMLQYEPRERKKPKELLNDPWLLNEASRG